MIKATDIYHHYLGCKCRFTYSEGDHVDFLLGTVNDYKWILAFDGQYSGKHVNSDVEIDLDTDAGKLQLYLHDPAELPADLKSKYKGLCHYSKSDAGTVVSDTPESLLFLFQNYVDAFDLIKNGEAIKIGTPSIPCDICNGTGKRIDTLTQEERICLACNGTGKE